MLWSTGAYYDGYWKNDHACGEGIFKQNGSIYSGYFQND